MANFKKFAAAMLAVVLCVTLLVGCDGEDKNTDDPTAAPTATADPSANDAAATTDFVAKVGGQKIYANEYYFALYSAISEVYYDAVGSDGSLYDEELTDEENYQKMLEFLNSTNADGVKNMDLVIDKTLDIAARFAAAVILGKQAGELNSEYAISQEEIDSNMDYVDEEATYGASYYDMSRDEYYFAMYGMNVNEAKRYVEAQLYAQMHRQAWAEGLGYVLEATAPSPIEEPEKPEDISEDATDEEKEAYEEALSEYNEEMEKYEEEYAEYETELAAYTEAYNKYWEQYREYYNNGADDNGANKYDIVTVRYLYVSTLDEDGNALSDSEKAEKKAEAEKYMGLVNGGLDFAKLVKGFSDSETASTDLGLLDLTSIVSFDDNATEWAKDSATPVSDAVKLFEGKDGFYIVQKVGVTNFDKTEGIVASTDEASHDIVKANVEYDMLNELYNKVLDEKMATEEFAITEENRDAMQTLADQYIETSEKYN